MHYLPTKLVNRAVAGAAAAPAAAVRYGGSGGAAIPVEDLVFVGGLLCVVFAGVFALSSSSSSCSSSTSSSTSSSSSSCSSWSVALSLVLLSLSPPPLAQGEVRRVEWVEVEQRHVHCFGRSTDKACGLLIVSCLKRWPRFRSGRANRSRTLRPWRRWRRWLAIELCISAKSAIADKTTRMANLWFESAFLELSLLAGERRRADRHREPLWANV